MPFERPPSYLQWLIAVILRAEAEEVEDHVEEVTPRTARERAELEEIAGIGNTEGHPANDPGHPDHAAAPERKLALRGVGLAERNVTVARYRDPPGDLPIASGR